MNSINVSIAEIKFGCPDHKLITRLGSCVGIAFLDFKNKKFALTHSLLPYEPESVNCTNAKYVDCAIELLIEFFSKQSKLNEIYAVVAGGGNMTNYSPLKQTVGELNIEASLNLLSQYKIKILKQDTGGDYGRRLEVDCNTGEFEIFKIPRIRKNFNEVV